MAVIKRIYASHNWLSKHDSGFLQPLGTHRTQQLHLHRPTPSLSGAFNNHWDISYFLKLIHSNVDCLGPGLSFFVQQCILQTSFGRVWSTPALVPLRVNRMYVWCILLISQSPFDVHYENSDYHYWRSLIGSIWRRNAGEMHNAGCVSQAESGVFIQPFIRVALSKGFKQTHSDEIWRQPPNPWASNRKQTPSPTAHTQTHTVDGGGNLEKRAYIREDLILKWPECKTVGWHIMGVGGCKR